MKTITLSLLMLSGFGAALQAQNVGIGTNTPTYPLTVISDASNKGLVQKAGSSELGFYVSASGAAYVQTWSPTDLYFTTNNGNAKVAIANATGYVGIATTTPSAQFDINGTLRIRGNGAAAGKVLTSIDASGNATWQTPATGTGIGFRGELGDEWAVTQAAGEFTVHGFTEAFDDGGGFNGSAGTFTAPSDGVYQFVANLNWNQPTSTTGSSIIVARLYLTRGALTNVIEQENSNLPNITNYDQSQTITSIIKLTAGDVISLRVDPQVSFTYYLSGNGSTECRFSGSKLY